MARSMEISRRSSALLFPGLLKRKRPAFEHCYTVRQVSNANMERLRVLNVQAELARKAAAVKGCSERKEKLEKVRPVEKGKEKVKEKMEKEGSVQVMKGEKPTERAIFGKEKEKEKEKLERMEVAKPKSYYERPKLFVFGNTDTDSQQRDLLPRRSRGTGQGGPHTPLSLK